MDHIILGLVSVAAVAIGIFWRFGRTSHRHQRDSQSASREAPAPTPPMEEEFDPAATRIIGGDWKPATERRGGCVIDGAQAKLVGMVGEMRGIYFPLVPTGLTIGRGVDADIQLADRRISQRHAWVGIVSGRAVVRDLGSTNGTFLNATLDRPVKEAELRSNDVLLIGGHGGAQFRFLTS